MHCPHCREEISVFSRAIIRFGKVKTCPHCGGAAMLAVDWARLALLLVPAVLAGFVFGSVLKSLGASGSLATLLAVGLLMVFALRLTPLRKAD